MLDSHGKKSEGVNFDYHCCLCDVSLEKIKKWPVRGAFSVTEFTNMENVKGNSENF